MGSLGPWRLVDTMVNINGMRPSPRRTLLPVTMPVSIKPRAVSASFRGSPVSNLITFV